MVFTKDFAKGCDTFVINRACLEIISNYTEDLQLESQITECVQCDLVPRATLHPMFHESFTISTAYPTQLNIHDNNGISFFNDTIHFGENGGYLLKFDHAGRYSFTTVKEPEDIFLPIIYGSIFLLIMKILWEMGCIIQRKVQANDSVEEHEDKNANNVPQSISKPRIKSLDTFRGISIIFMIFVNYNGGWYHFFQHSAWNGLKLADYLFPWFMWIMGVCIAITMHSMRCKRISRRKIFFKIVKRSLILFILGINLNTANGVYNFETLRILGVLQRFSICYFFLATLHMFFSCDEHINEASKKSWFEDIVPYWPEWIVCSILLVMHLLVTFLVAKEGCPRGYLGPGGMHEHGLYAKCSGGAGGYIDRAILTKNHIHNKYAYIVIYSSTNYMDSYGILGTFTSIFLAFLGLQAGKIIITYKKDHHRILRWIVWGIVTGLISLILCKFSINDGWIPINRHYFSVSFILAAGSTSFFLLALCYYLVDVKKWWAGEPFHIAGMNSILLFYGQQYMKNTFPWGCRLSSTAPHWAYLLMSLWGTVVWILIAMWCHWKKIYIAV